MARGSEFHLTAALCRKERAPKVFRCMDGTCKSCLLQERSERFSRVKMSRGIVFSLVLICALHIRSSHQQTVFVIDLQDQTKSIGETGFFYVLLSSPSTESGTWYKDGVQLNPIANKIVIDVSGNVRQVVINNIQPSDAGRYSLRIAGLETSADLIVSGVTITAGLQDRTVQQGTNVELEVRLSQVVSVTDVLWEHYTNRLSNNAKYQITSNGLFHRLTIQNVQQSEAGQYTFTVNTLVTQMTLLVSTTTPTDVDECQLGTDNCHQNAQCTNTIGSFTCSCITGYTGNGVICNDINECASGTTNNCSPNANCSNTQGSYTCTCRTGFSGNGFSCSQSGVTVAAGLQDRTVQQGTNVELEVRLSQAVSFADVTWEHYTNRLSNNAKYQITSNGLFHRLTIQNVQQSDAGQYTFTVNTSVTQMTLLVSTTTPTDVDECQLGTDNCHPNAQCTNTIGSFTCSCITGYTGRGVICNDINECASETTNNCSPNANCSNTQGSYTCTCRTGFSGNGFSCSQSDNEGDKTIIGVVAAGTGVSAIAAMMCCGYVLFRRRRNSRNDEEEERNDEEERKKKQFGPKDHPPHPPSGGDAPLVRM